VWVVLGNVAMSATGVALALACIAVETLTHPATDAPGLRVFLVVAASGLTVALMVKLISALSVRAIHDFALLNDMVAVATRSLSLESGLDSFMLMASDLVRADRVTAYRIPVDAFGAEPPVDDSEWALSHWNRRAQSATAVESGEDGAPLPLDAIRQTTTGARSESDDAWIWSRATDGSVVVLRFVARRRWYQPQVSWQYAFDRIVPELESLVNLTGFIAQLSEMTRTDYLTGLANRRAFMDRLEQEVRKVERNGDALTVAMLDLDRFKQFNDEHGHLLGDQLLRGFAALLTSRGRAIDLAARYGGEEFCLILPSTDAHGARQLLADLHQASRRLREPMGVTFSAGLASWQPGDDPEDLLTRADAGLYQAKSLGRDRTVIVDRRLEPDETGPR
jgi:diguanylate cyclase (GGDEF)-like protein